MMCVVAIDFIARVRILYVNTTNRSIAQQLFANCAYVCLHGFNVNGVWLTFGLYFSECLCISINLYYLF
jgi:hypothetical protein